MLIEPTMEKLKTLKLDAMAAAWAEQQKSAATAKLAFDERLGLLVDAECLFRENRRLGRLLKEAKLKLSQACVEDIDYPPKRELDKAVIRQLGTCRWVHEHQSITITGPTGVGKTYVACALARVVQHHRPALRQGRVDRRGAAKPCSRKVHGGSRATQPAIASGVST